MSTLALEHIPVERFFGAVSAVSTEDWGVESFVGGEYASRNGSGQSGGFCGPKGWDEDSAD